MDFFTALISDMSAKQKGGIIALLGGLLLSALGLSAISDAQLQIGPNGIDFNAREELSRASDALSSLHDNGSLEG